MVWVPEGRASGVTALGDHRTHGKVLRIYAKLGKVKFFQIGDKSMIYLLLFSFGVPYR